MRRFTLIHFQIGSEGRTETTTSRWGRLIRDPLALARAIRRERAVIVHVNTSLNRRAFWRDLAHSLIAKACGARVVFQVHGGSLPRDFCRDHELFMLALSRALQLPDVIVVLAEQELDAYQQFVPEQQVLRVPNGIDVEPFQAVPRQPSPGGPLRLAYFGRLARSKGLFELLDGLKAARDGGTQATLVLAGNGGDEHLLRARVAELGLSDCVSFVGVLAHEGKVALLARSDAFVLPSHSEGLPYALLESMASGVPPLISRVGAVPEVVIDGVHGLLVPPGEPRAIAAALERMFTRRDDLGRMGAACRARVAELYSLQRVASDVSRVYRTLCNVEGEACVE